MKMLQVKVREDSYGWLNAAARETNLVWNYCNEVSFKALIPYYGKGKWLSWYDLTALLAGTYRHVDHLTANSINEVARQFTEKRDQARKRRLAWRKSGGAKRSLGWVPFRANQLRWKDGAIVMAGHRFRVFDSYGLETYDFRSGSFSQNALGEWFLNVAVETVAEQPTLPSKAIGLDLGLKTVATGSDGRALQAGRWTARFANRLASAQRRGHKRQAKRIHRAAANARKDALHKFSTTLVKEYGAIYIGDVSSTQLVKTRMAKSVLDSGWGMLRTMLHYKGHQAGCIVEDINESFTTRACSSCGALTGPQGRTGLVVREWTCGDCGTPHDRDVNAAKNILARGLSGPSAGTIEGVQKTGRGSKNHARRGGSPTVAQADRSAS